MALTATVTCNCLREGRTTEPPFPRTWLREDEVGNWGLRPEYASAENQSRFCDWKWDCCVHDNMDYAAEWISGWGTFGRFQDAVQHVGSETLPVLNKELPDERGGAMSPDSASRALQELDLFRQAKDLGRKTVLIDTDTAINVYVSPIGNDA